MSNAEEDVKTWRKSFVTEDVWLDRETANQEVEADGSEALQVRSDNRDDLVCTFNQNTICMSHFTQPNTHTGCPRFIQYWRKQQHSCPKKGPGKSAPDFQTKSLAGPFWDMSVIVFVSIERSVCHRPKSAYWFFWKVHQPPFAQYYLTPPVASKECQDEGDAEEHHHVDVIKQGAHRVPLLLVVNNDH